MPLNSYIKLAQVNSPRHIGPARDMWDISSVTLEWQSRNGNIVCNHCPNQPQWCKHIEWAIKSRQDLKIIWAPSHEGDHVSYELTVPIFPTTQQYTHVELYAVTDTRKNVRWIDAPDRTPGMQAESIGALNEGEGISVIRELLTEEMWKRLGKIGKVPECSASHHGLLAQKFWESDLEISKRTAAIWSVLTNGWCIYCRINDPGSTDPDLVPANQSTWNPNG